jgi:hypothetical protein
MYRMQMWLPGSFLFQRSSNFLERGTLKRKKKL